MFNNLKVGTKLYLLIGLLIGGLVVYGAISYVSQTQVEIGSPMYEEILEDKDLVADILPRRST